MVSNASRTFATYATRQWITERLTTKSANSLADLNPKCGPTSEEFRSMATGAERRLSFSRAYGLLIVEVKSPCTANSGAGRENDKQNVVSRADDTKLTS
jgi:hypothetical protein